MFYIIVKHNIEQKDALLTTKIISSLERALRQYGKINRIDLGTVSAFDEFIVAIKTKYGIKTITENMNEMQKKLKDVEIKTTDKMPIL